MQTSYADEKFPPEEEEQNVATPTDGLILEAENIAEVHKILINESCLLCTVIVWVTMLVYMAQVIAHVYLGILIVQRIRSSDEQS